MLVKMFLLYITLELASSGSPTVLTLQDEFLPANVTTGFQSINSLPQLQSREWWPLGKKTNGGLARVPSRNGQSTNDVCTVIRPSHRRDCGSMGITAQGCAARGCCWDNRVQRVPYCFYREGSCSSGAALLRLDCGDKNTRIDQCIARGCCWDGSYNDRAWCFYQSNACSVVPARRVNCGSGPQMNEVQCRQKGCCFDGRAQMKCFKPAVF